MDEYFDLRIEEKHSRRHLRPLPGLSRRLWPEQDGFKCVHCHVFVSSEPALSGVQNRNHCPYCLWSRHLDLARPGDRLAACKEKMKPVGLTLKKTAKKYGPGLGELMLVHLCQECGKVSINRIAADDLADTLYKCFEHSLVLDVRSKAAIKASGIQMLTARDQELVKARLFGA
jgi:hypothetical protein